MSRITEQLLRKRAEHNEGRLTTLEEVSLHQQELVKIENLDVLCRHLKILYLQNNIIEKMENLNKLKELEYINLALNNIAKIENIEGCESLKKIDLTVNFIDVEALHDSTICLAALPCIKEIYLTGNPCQDWKGCKDYIIARVPTLELYNGEFIAPSHRIKAQQILPELKESLFQAIEKRKLEKRQQDYDQQIRKEKQKMMTEQQKAQQKVPYSPQVRRQMYHQMAKEKIKKDKERNPEKYEPQKPIQMYTKNGEIRQCNQGKFKYSLCQWDDPDYTFFEIEVPKHLETSELEVNINPNWLSVRIKKQLTQLKLSEQIVVSESRSERSQLTGELKLTMKKLKSHEFLRVTKEKEKAKAKLEADEKKKTEKQQREKTQRLCDEYERKMEQQEDQIPDLQ